MSISRSQPVPPKPETTCAILMSAGCVRPTPTIHYYEETRAVVLPGPNGHAWEFLYRCAKTGVVRRWGVAERAAGHGEVAVPTQDASETDDKPSDDQETN